MKITESAKRISLYAGILIVVTALYVLLFEPVRKYEERMTEDITLKTALLNRYKIALEGRTDLEVRSKMAKTLIDRAKNRIFFAKTQALAAAQLQSMIQTSAGRHNVTIKSMNIKKTEKPIQSGLKTGTGGYSTISIQIATYSSIRGLIDLLYDLESAPRFINISSVTMKGEIVKEASKLDTTMIVEGLAEIES